MADDPIDFIPHQSVHVGFHVDPAAPRVYAIRAKDFSDAVTGLEYDNTQFGDGGP